MTSPIHDVQQFGQSIWYDMISRELVRSGELARMVDEGGILGVTSNPAIFEKAIGSSSDYDDQIRQLVEQEGIGEPIRLFEPLAIADIQTRGADEVTVFKLAVEGELRPVVLDVEAHATVSDRAFKLCAVGLWDAAEERLPFRAAHDQEQARPFAIFRVGRTVAAGPKTRFKLCEGRNGEQEDQNEEKLSHASEYTTQQRRQR